MTRAYRLTVTAVEKRQSTDGLVDNIDPRRSDELELDELPTFEKPAPIESAPISLKDKIITCFWIAINTLSTLGLIFLSKKCDRDNVTQQTRKGHR